MKKRYSILFFLILIFTFSSNVKAMPIINLFEYSLNIDGNISLLGGSIGGPFDPVPSGTNVSSYDPTTGLGSINVSINTPGSHYVSLFVDHEIDEPTNTFFNESGATSSSPAAGQTWEIDEPGFAFGDIRDQQFPPFDPGNFESVTLDNSNNVPAGLEDDVSMAIGWDFNLIPLETATIVFDLSLTAPLGFFLSHTDQDSASLFPNDSTIYFASTLNIEPVTNGPIPEPSTIALLGIGFVGLAGAEVRRRRKRKQL